MSKPPKSRPSEQDVELSLIRDDGATQLRVGIDAGTVAEYAAVMEAASMPRVVLFQDGETYWLGDGHHRVQAARTIGRKTIPAEVRQGGKRDAWIFALSANAHHGLRLTSADKRKIVVTMLGDPEWSAMSDRALAKVAGVSHPLVGEVRRSLVTDTTLAPGDVPKPLPRRGPSRPPPLSDAPAPRRPDALERIDAEEDARAAAAEAERATAPVGRVCDGFGDVVTDPALAAVFARVSEFADLARDVHELKRRILVLADTTAGHRLHPQTIDRWADDMAAHLRHATPYAAAPDSVVKVKGWAFVTKLEHDRVPEAERLAARHAKPAA